MLYAPMADVGGLMYDKDAVYINIPDWKVIRGCIARKGTLLFCSQQLQSKASRAWKLCLM